jgi:hypothetical protein
MGCGGGGNPQREESRIGKCYVFCIGCEDSGYHPRGGTYSGCLETEYCGKYSDLRNRRLEKTA